MDSPAVSRRFSLHKLAIWLVMLLFGSACTMRNETHSAQTPKEQLAELQVIASAVALFDLPPCVSKALRSLPRYERVTTTNLKGFLLESETKLSHSSSASRLVSTAEIRPAFGMTANPDSCGGFTSLTFYRVQFLRDEAVAVFDLNGCNEFRQFDRFRQEGSSWRLVESQTIMTKISEDCHGGPPARPGDILFGENDGFFGAKDYGSAIRLCSFKDCRDDWAKERRVELYVRETKEGCAVLLKGMVFGMPDQAKELAKQIRDLGASERWVRLQRIEGGTRLSPCLGEVLRWTQKGGFAYAGPDA